MRECGITGGIIRGRFSRTPPWFVVWLGSHDLGWQQRPPAGSYCECGYVRLPQSSCWKLSGYESVPSASCWQWALRERERNMNKGGKQINEA